MYFWSARLRREKAFIKNCARTRHFTSVSVMVGVATFIAAWARRLTHFTNRTLLLDRCRRR